MTLNMLKNRRLQQMKMQNIIDEFHSHQLYSPPIQFTNKYMKQPQISKFNLIYGINHQPHSHKLGLT